MRATGIPFTLLAAGSLLGCAGNPAGTAVEAASLQPIYQSRFQLVSGAAYGLALDTKTGLLCHTFEMVDTDKHIPQCVDLLVHEQQIVSKLTVTEGAAQQ